MALFFCLGGLSKEFLNYIIKYKQNKELQPDINNCASRKAICLTTFIRLKSLPSFCETSEK